MCFIVDLKYNEVFPIDPKKAVAPIAKFTLKNLVAYAVGSFFPKSAYLQHAVVSSLVKSIATFGKDMDRLEDLRNKMYPEPWKRLSQMIPTSLQELLDRHRKIGVKR